MLFMQKDSKIKVDKFPTEEKKCTVWICKSNRTCTNYNSWHPETTGKNFRKNKLLLFSFNYKCLIMN